MRQDPVASRPKPAEQRHLDLLACPTIASQLPFDGPDGTRWERFSGECPSCRRRFPPDRMHGRIERGLGGVAVLEAVAACRACRALVPFHLRLHPDGSWQYPAPDGKGWIVQETRRARIHLPPRLLLASALLATLLLLLLLRRP